MPVHIEELTTDVTVGDGPLNEAQLERLVELVLRRIEDQQRHNDSLRDATAIRASAVPPSRILA